MGEDQRLYRLEEIVADLQREVAQLIQQVQWLKRQQDAGPDPRLWAGDPHDPHR